MIYFHYSAPLLPLFWMAFAEGFLELSRFGAQGLLAPRTVALGALAMCVGAQFILGPAAGIISAAADWSAGKSVREKKAAFLSKIPADASLTAPLPYLSHLAMRQELYSLHYILKGLKTLSRAQYLPPPPPEFVLIDYNDSATFDASADFYHPAMKTVDGRIIPSSDRLLHDFLRVTSWQADSQNELTLLKRAPPKSPPDRTGDGASLQIGQHTELESISKSTSSISIGDSFEIELIWLFKPEREVIPSMFLEVTPKGGTATAIVISKGLCAPEANAGRYQETWRVDLAGRLPSGDYSLEVVFVDNSSRVWYMVRGTPIPPSAVLSSRISLGDITVGTDGSSAER
jgi:hypothetical protein